MPTPIPHTRPTPTPLALTSGVQAAWSPNDAISDDHDASGEPITITSEPTSSDPTSATRATPSDTTAVPGEAPGDNNGVGVKKTRKRKFRPSEAKTQRLASNTFYFHFSCSPFSGALPSVTGLAIMLMGPRPSSRSITMTYRMNAFRYVGPSPVTIPLTPLQEFSKQAEDEVISTPIWP